MLDREGVGQLVKMATERGRKTRPESESRNLRRARWRTVVGRVLPPDRAELRFLLTVPRADRATGGGAGCGQRQAESRRRKNEVEPGNQCEKHRGS